MAGLVYIYPHIDYERADNGGEYREDGMSPSADRQKHHQQQHRYGKVFPEQIQLHEIDFLKVSHRFFLIRL